MLGDRSCPPRVHLLRTGAISTSAPPVPIEILPAIGRGLARYGVQSDRDRFLTVLRPSMTTISLARSAAGADCNFTRQRHQP